MKINYTCTDSEKCKYSHADDCPVMVARKSAAEIKQTDGRMEVYIEGVRVGWQSAGSIDDVYVSTAAGTMCLGAPCETSATDNILRSRHIDGTLGVEHAYHGTHAGMF